MSEVTTTAAPQGGLVAKVAGRFDIDPSKLMHVLKTTVFRKRDGSAPSNEEMAALLAVCDQYGLNPFTKEIYAFEDRGAVVPVVSVDGWARIINDNPALDGIEFRYSDETVEMEDAKPAPAWCEVVLHRKDRTRPTVVREYLDEVYRAPFKKGMRGPWQTHTKRFLRHKTLIQGARIAFGFSGIYDEDEAARIKEQRLVDERAARDAHPSVSVEAGAPSSEKGVDGLKSRLAHKQAETVPAEDALFDEMPEPVEADAAADEAETAEGSGRD